VQWVFCIIQGCRVGIGFLIFVSFSVEDFYIMETFSKKRGEDDYLGKIFFKREKLLCL